MNKIKSIEPEVANYFNNILKNEYKLDAKLEQASLNDEIDYALEQYQSKNGAGGGNRVDCKLLLSDKTTKHYPVLIEYKGLKDKLLKLNNNQQIDNISPNGEENLKNIKEYAVNGAIHYANAILHYSSKYDEIISIGITGYYDEQNQFKTKIAVYFVSKDNLGLGQKIDEPQDLSFLKKENFDEFIEKCHNANLSVEEKEIQKNQRELEIDHCLSKLNKDIYNTEGLGSKNRVYLVIASILATLGVGDEIEPLEKNDLKSSNEFNNKDGDIILRKIQAFLDKKNIPRQKKEMIIKLLSTTLMNEKLNKVENGESQLKRVFCKIIDDIGIYYKIGLTVDFTGKLFNEMYNWLGYAEDKPNDVVLTPPYVAKLLVKLANINKDSYVWDFATGSGGLLVQAMNEMIKDANNEIKSYDELKKKIVSIKTKQILGIEILDEISMLAILNMILMGDGSSNILNKDSLKDFKGNYEYNDANEKFPANAFILNPPYSADGKGMIFVKKAFSMMDHHCTCKCIRNVNCAQKAVRFFGRPRRQQNNGPRANPCKASRARRGETVTGGWASPLHVQSAQRDCC
ncbi:MAG: SAM-dependent DNA methyltransferase, partial [Mycoplasmataceae bacterium]|nr:SAM-dependent DNA methyltransferase [Mycoplasmataceae bacterium]